MKVELQGKVRKVKAGWAITDGYAMFVLPHRPRCRRPLESVGRLSAAKMQKVWNRARREASASRRALPWDVITWPTPIRRFKRFERLGMQERYFALAHELFNSPTFHFGNLRDAPAFFVRQRQRHQLVGLIMPYSYSVPPGARHAT